MNNIKIGDFVRLTEKYYNRKEQMHPSAAMAGANPNQSYEVVNFCTYNDQPNSFNLRIVINGHNTGTWMVFRSYCRPVKKPIFIIRGK